jgi:O-antigen/teichoic acid export membrane protein
MKWSRRVSSVWRTDAPAHLVIGRLGIAASALLSAPIVARAVGPEGRGETAAALALFYMTPIFIALGVPLEVRRLAATHEGHPALRSARVLSLCSLLISVPLGAAMWFTIFHEFEYASRIVASVGVGLCPLAINWMCDVSYLVATGRFRAVLVMQLTQPAIYVSLILAVWILGVANTATILAANVAGTLGTFFAGLLLTRTSIRGTYYPRVKILRRGLKFAGSSIAESSSSKLDQVLALPLLGAYQAGLYSVAVTIASLPAALGQALGGSFFAAIARASADQQSLLKSQAARSTVVLALIVCPVLGVAGYLSIPLVFGQEFDSAIPATLIAVVGSAAALIAYVCSMCLAAEGKGMQMTLAQIASLIVGIATLIVIGPPLGAVGAAIASLVSYMTLMLILLRALSVRAYELVPKVKDFKRPFHYLLKSA